MLVSFLVALEQNKHLMMFKIRKRSKQARVLDTAMGQWNEIIRPSKVYCFLNNNPSYSPILIDSRL